MAAKKVTETKEVTEEITADAPVETKLNDAGWRDPASVYADDDNSIDARMWRLEKDRAPK